MLGDVELAQGWRLWPVVEVRAAGFPVSVLSPLASNAVASAADEVLVAEAHLAELRPAFVAQLKGAEDAAAKKARRKLFKGTLEAAQARAVGGASWADALDALAGKERALAEAAASLQRGSAAALRERLADDAFRRALLWQNPSALRGGLAALERASDDDERNNTRRGRELMTSYLQRYATKNDTVGFFGPVAWGSLTSGAGLTQRAGPTLVASQTVQLEPWAVAAVFDALVGRDRSLAHLLPTTLPARARLEEGVLLGAPGGRSTWARRRLSDDEYALLALADGVTPLVDQVTRAATALKLEPEALLATADRLVSSGLLVRELPVEISTTPEAAGVTRLEQLAARNDGAPARAALDAWSGLFAAVAEVRDKANQAAALGPAIDAVESQFTALSGEAAERKPGEMYACRTTLLLNCRRDHETEIGADIVDKVRRPLAVVLAAARWFTYECARGFQALVDETLNKRAHGRARVPLAELYTALIPIFRGGEAVFIAEAAAEVQRRWHTVLAPERPASLDEVEARARAHLAAPHPGWPSARHHSPDILLARIDGELVPVLGEVHPGTNTLAIMQAVSQHPDATELRERFARDTVPLVVEGQHDSYALCAQDHLLTARDLRLDTGSRFLASPGGEALRLGDCDIWRSGAELIVEHLPSGRRWPALVVLERIVRLNATTELHLHTQGPTRPRVTLGEMIIQRAAWSTTAAALEPLKAAKGDARVVEARRLRGALGLPEQVFVRTDNEKKPIFLDLRSPLSIDLAVRVLRGATKVTFSEMLPGTGELWLEDHQARPHVAEIRMVAVDPKPWSPIPLEGEA